MGSISLENEGFGAFSTCCASVFSNRESNSASSKKLLTDRLGDFSSNSSKVLVVGIPAFSRSAKLFYVSICKMEEGTSISGVNRVEELHLKANDTVDNDVHGQIASSAPFSLFMTVGLSSLPESSPLRAELPPPPSLTAKHAGMVWVRVGLECEEQREV